MCCMTLLTPFTSEDRFWIETVIWEKQKGQMNWKGFGVAKGPVQSGGGRVLFARVTLAGTGPVQRESGLASVSVREAGNGAGDFHVFSRLGRIPPPLPPNDFHEGRCGFRGTFEQNMHFFGLFLASQASVDCLRVRGPALVSFEFLDRPFPR